VIAVVKGPARLWDARTGSAAERAASERRAVEGAVLQPDSRTVPDGQRRTKTPVLGRPDRRARRPPAAHEGGSVGRPPSSPDGDYVLTRLRQGCQRLERADVRARRKPPMTPPGSSAMRVGFSPDGEDRPDRRLGQQGPAVGRRDRLAARKSADATESFVYAAVFSPGRRDRSHRELGQDRAASGTRAAARPLGSRSVTIRASRSRSSAPTGDGCERRRRRHRSSLECILASGPPSPDRCEGRGAGHAAAAEAPRRRRDRSGGTVEAICRT